MGWGSHSTHTSYSRGVSILVYRSVDFQIYDKLILKGDGILLCNVHQLKCIMVALYIQPPYNSEALRTLLAFQLSHPDLPLIIVGDLNCYMDPILDKHPPPVNGRKVALNGIAEVCRGSGMVGP